MSTACNPRSTSQINHLASCIAGAEGWVHAIRDEGVSLGSDCWRKEIYDDAVWIDECFFYAPPRRSSTQLMDVDGVEDLALQSRASRWTPPDPRFPWPPSLDPVATGEGPSQQLNRMTHQTRSLSSSIRILDVSPGSRRLRGDSSPPARTNGRVARVRESSPGIGISTHAMWRGRQVHERLDAEGIISSPTRVV